MSNLHLPIEVCAEPRRKDTVRRQLDEMERIRDFVYTLPMHDRKRWASALTALTDALWADLAVQEGTGTLGALFAAGYDADNWEDAGAAATDMQREGV